MCKYCEQGEHIKTANGTYEAVTSIAQEDGKWCLVTVASINTTSLFGEMVRTSFSIDYCPMCGRKLEG